MSAVKYRCTPCRAVLGTDAEAAFIHALETRHVVEIVPVERRSGQDRRRHGFRGFGRRAADRYVEAAA